MPPTPCEPCNCIPGNISNDKFKQDIEVILCNIVAALAGTTDDLLVTQTFTTTTLQAAVGPFNGLTKVAAQVHAVGGQPDDWSFEIYGSYDGVTYGRILTHSLGENPDGSYVIDQVLGVKYIKIVPKVVSLGGASSLVVSVYGNNAP